MNLRQRVARSIIRAAFKAAGTGSVSGDMSFAISDTPNWSTWDAKKAIEEGMKSSTWVYRCINRKSSQIGSVPWKVETFVGKEWVEAPEHPLNNVIKKPNPFYSFTDIIESISVYLDLSGKAFIGVNRAGDSTELWIIPSHVLKIVPSKTEIIARYLYCVDGREIPLDPKDVIYTRYLDPANPIEGLSPLMAAARTIDSEVEAVKWNKYAMENRAVSDIALTATESMTGDQFKTFKEILHDEYTRAKNARKPLMLGNFKIERLNMSPVEMDFIESRKMTRIEICAALDVPPMLVGIPDANTYANYETAQKAFWLDTIIPLLRKVKNAINPKVQEQWGDNVRLSYDLSDVPALNENRNELHTRTREDYKGGIVTLNEARREIGEEETEDGDEFYKPLPSPLGDTIVDPNKPAPAPASKPNPDSKPAPGKSGANVLPNSPDVMLELKCLNLATQEQKEIYFKTFDAARENFYGAVESRVKARFRSEREAVATAINGAKTANEVWPAIQKAMNAERSNWDKLMVGTYSGIAKHFGERVFNQLKSEAGLLMIEYKEEKLFDIFKESLMAQIRMIAASKVNGIIEATLGKLRDVLAAGVDLGEGIPQLAKRIVQSYDDFIGKGRATMIARTEVIGASNFGSRAGAKDTGLDLEKEWLATSDSRTRESHAHINGQRKSMDDRYSNNLMYPGDPTGKASEVIQCRCTEVYHAID